MSSLLYLLPLVLLPDGEAIAWTYANQDAWSATPSSQCTGSLQSPVDLPSTGDVTTPGGEWLLESFGDSVQRMGPLIWNTSWAMANISLSAGHGTWTATMREPYRSMTHISLYKQTGAAGGSEDFFLESFSYRSPSEMRIEGKTFDMEAQFFHRSRDGRMLIMSVLLEVKLVYDNPFMSQFWKDVPKPGASPVEKFIYAPYYSSRAMALPDDRSFFVYNGSLTQPPCTEGVIWVVFRDPVPISFEQRNLFRKKLDETDKSMLSVSGAAPDGVIKPWDAKMGTNNRMIQALGRQVVFEKMIRSPTTHPVGLKRKGTVAEEESDSIWYWVVAFVGVALVLMLLGGLVVMVVACLHGGLDAEEDNKSFGMKRLTKRGASLSSRGSSLSSREEKLPLTWDVNLPREARLRAGQPSTDVRLEPQRQEPLHVQPSQELRPHDHHLHAQQSQLQHPQRQPLQVPWRAAPGRATPQNIALQLLPKAK